MQLLLERGVTAVLALATALALVPLPHGALRVLDFPRLQIIVLAALTGVWAATLYDIPALVVLATVGLVQAGHVARFTPVWPRQSQAPRHADPARQVSLLAANVKLSNRAFDRCIAMVRREAPDLFMAIEIDAGWQSALEEALAADWPHRIAHPLDNGYGIALFSRLPFEEAEVRERLVRDVPSIRAVLRLDGGGEDGRFRLHVVHPEPPIPQQDSKGRDAELGLVGLEVAEDPLPSLVAGDLNDVAWSHTTRRFQRLSGLQDPRVGRGFYNTFDARYRLLRWPLDHLFHDPRFRLVEMRRMEDIGSDHFPMLFRLQLEPLPRGEEPAPPEPGERAEVREMAAEERAVDREPIGGDWEKGVTGD